MTILLVQTFLLLLGAFLLGASLACLVRRTFSGRRAADAPAPSSGLAAATAAGPAVVPGDADRFGRALTGGAGTASAFQPTGPVVEVQPRPPVRVSPLIEPVVEPAPMPVAEEAPQPAPVAVEPAPQPLPPEPQPEPVSEPVYEPAPEPSPGPEPEPSRADELSYTQVAVAAAAAAATLAAARGEERASEETAAEEDAIIEDERPEAPPSSDDGTDRSYTEVAVGAAAGLAAAAVAAAADEEERKAESEPESDEAEALSSEEPAVTEASDDASSQFGTPVADEVAPAAASVGDDFTRIHTIDAVLRDRLHSLGMTRFADIGGWSASDVMRFSQSLGVEPGRIEQENWVGQAQVLAGGGVTDYPRWRGPELMPRAALPADGERLNRIIGIDPDSEGVLRANGVTSLADIAAWTEDDVSWFERILGAPGRIGAENWVEQARFLTRGSGVADSIESIGAPAAGVAAAAAAAVAAAALEGTSPPPAEPEASAEAPAADEAQSEPPSETETPPAAAAAGSRSDGYTGLRSVRSEALVGSSGFALPPVGDVDDLKRIRGIGVLIEKKLHSLGITSYEQVANWTGEDIDRISQVLDFKGRIERENWIEQARILASGGQTEFSRRVDKGEV